MVTKIGLDLGYAHITTSDVNAAVKREPSVVLVDKDTRRIISVGEAAYNSNSENGMLVRPFKNGLLFDGPITRGVIENAIGSVQSADKVRCVIGVSAGFLPKQEKEIFEMMSAAGADECFSVTRSVAALIGAGYSPNMSVISVNIGAKTTEITVLYRGKIFSSVAQSVGGEDFDRAVKEYVLEQGDVNVSLSIARSIKEHLGAVWSGRSPEPIEIEGTLSLTGNRVKMSIGAEDIVGVFEAPLRSILTAVANAVKKIPLDFVEEIFENGIVLTGGGAELFGLDIMMEKVLDIKVRKPRDAMDSVAKGLARINNIMPLRMRSNNKNITQQLSRYYESKKKESSAVRKSN